MSLGNRFVLVMVAIVIIASSIGIASAYTYDRQAAVVYARVNWNHLVPGTTYFNSIGGGDCTNFVSQSLNAGGWRQVRHPTNSALSWYYNGYYPGQYSNSWAGVNALRNFVVGSGRGTEVLFASGAYYLPSTSLIKIGDVIQLDGLYGYTPDGQWDHTMLVTNVYMDQGVKRIKVTQHTDNYEDRDLQEVLRIHSNGRLRALLLKDTYSY